MGLYKKLKEIEKSAIDSGNVHAMGYAIQEITKITSNKLNSYKYTHADLTKSEVKNLLAINNLSEDSILIGGEVHEIVNKKWVKTKEIDLFIILDQIQAIIKKRI